MNRRKNGPQNNADISAAAGEGAAPSAHGAPPEEIARLERELEESIEAGLALEEALTAKSVEIAELESDLRTRDAQIDELAAAAARNADETAGAPQALASAKAQAARLTAELERERGAVADAEQRNAALLAERAVLQARIQDLEVYVEGRKRHWAELHARIAQYEDTIAGMGKTLKSRDGATGQHHEGVMLADLDDLAENAPLVQHTHIFSDAIPGTDVQHQVILLTGNLLLDDVRRKDIVRGRIRESDQLAEALVFDHGFARSGQLTGKLDVFGTQLIVFL
jgi:hypothetical protein